jgi:flagellar basal-body rod modification protein FlgD
MSVGSTGQSSGAASNSANGVLSTSNAQIQSEFNTFLTLLTTELQNQDPSSPLDTNQFTSQLVQFSQLEQTLNTNSDLTTLINGQQVNQMATAIGYIGQTVQASGGNFVLDGTDSDSLNYTLASSAKSVTINILNSSGQTIAQIPGTTDSGSNTVSYNGTYPGQPTLPAGQYSFSVTATDANGNSVQATTSTTGTVTGVDNTNGVVNLHLGNLVIPESTVTQILGSSSTGSSGSSSS